MITCKEDLIGTKIKFKVNSELVDVYIEHCLKHGISIMGTMSRDFKAVDYAAQHNADYLCVYDNNLFYRPNREMSDNCSRSIHMIYPADFKELTLEDFIPNEIAPELSVSKDTLNAHKHTLEDNKRSTGVPSPIIVENGSACDTRKDIFREMLTLARENNAFIQFDGFTENENDCIVVTFASLDEEYVVQSASDFKKLLSAQETLNKFLRVV